MGTHLVFDYDAVGDILYVNLVPPYAGQDSDMVSDFVVARSNPETGHIENLEILFFMERARNGEQIDVPIGGELSLLAEAS
ncbi:MAG: DUF2283 domain-containing protein [Dehalococcoidia bacterium]